MTAVPVAGVDGLPARRALRLRLAAGQAQRDDPADRTERRAERSRRATTAFLYLPISAPTTPQTIVKTIAQIHNDGSVSDRGAFGEQLGGLLGIAGVWTFDNAEKSQLMFLAYAPARASASSMRLSARSRPARYTV